MPFYFLKEIKYYWLALSLDAFLFFISNVAFRNRNDLQIDLRHSTLLFTRRTSSCLAEHIGTNQEGWGKEGRNSHFKKTKVQQLKKHTVR